MIKLFCVRAFLCRRQTAIGRGNIVYRKSLLERRAYSTIPHLTLFKLLLKSFMLLHLGPDLKQRLAHIPHSERTKKTKVEVSQDSIFFRTKSEFYNHLEILSSVAVIQSRILAISICCRDIMAQIMEFCRLNADFRKASYLGVGREASKSRIRG